jgi:hypothetical protein
MRACACTAVECTRLHTPPSGGGREKNHENTHTDFTAPDLDAHA